MKTGECIVYISDMHYNFTNGKVYKVINDSNDFSSIRRKFCYILDELGEICFFWEEEMDTYFMGIREYRKLKLERLKNGNR